jgi:hypothetical protein
MMDKKSKNKYETPVVVLLGETARGSGVCSTGLTPTSDVIDCTAGPTATQDCSAGLSAYRNCTAGTAALPACTAGVAATGACTAGGHVT